MPGSALDFYAGRLMGMEPQGRQFPRRPDPGLGGQGSSVQPQSSRPSGDFGTTQTQLRNLLPFLLTDCNVESTDRPETSGDGRHKTKWMDLKWKRAATNMSCGPQGHRRLRDRHVTGVGSSLAALECGVNRAGPRASMGMDLILRCDLRTEKRQSLDVRCGGPGTGLAWPEGFEVQS